MGHIQDADGTLTIQATPTQTVADLQAVADRVEEIGGLLRDPQAERLLLTNSQVKDGWLFFETDTGIGYARKGGSWVPAFGLQPEIALYPTGAAFSVNGAANVANWAALNTGGSYATPGWFTYDSTTGDVTCTKAGRYSVTARMAVAATPEWTDTANNNQKRDQSLVAYLVRNGSGSDVLAQDSLNTHRTYATMIKLDIGTIPLSAGEKVRMYIAATSAAINIGGTGRVAGELNIRYLGAL